MCGTAAKDRCIPVNGTRMAGRAVAAFSRAKARDPTSLAAICRTVLNSWLNVQFARFSSFV
jgi:hypothetical protein